MKESLKQDPPAHFDVTAVADSFPDNAQSLLLDHYLVDRETASARVFRVYQPTPAHYHIGCDEHLYVLSGRGSLWLHEPQNSAEFRPGSFLFFARRTVHAMPVITHYPVIFLSLDVPRRDPLDIHFVDPSDGTPETFIQEKP